MDFNNITRICFIKIHIYIYNNATKFWLNLFLSGDYFKILVYYIMYDPDIYVGRFFLSDCYLGKLISTKYSQHGVLAKKLADIAC